MNNANYRHLNKARSHFKRIGLPFKECDSHTQAPRETFMQGCWIEKGVLHYIPKRCLVGSLLHEAGHLATIPREYWRDLTPGDLEKQDMPSPFGIGGEFAAEAWGYATAIAADIPPEAAVHGSSPIMGYSRESGIISEGKSFEDYNAPGYFGDISRAELSICLDLIKGTHIGIFLLRIAGMSPDFPKMDSWFWGKRDTPAIPKGLMRAIAGLSDGSIDDRVSEFWQVE